MVAFTMSSANLAAFLEAFFTDRLIAPRRVSPHTVASCRDIFRLLLQFAQKEFWKSPSKLAIPDLNAALIGAFLDNLEKTRAMPLAAEMSASQRAGPFFVTWRWSAPCTRQQSSVYSRSHQSGNLAG
jgi:hypothetical protein